MNGSYGFDLFFLVVCMMVALIVCRGKREPGLALTFLKCWGKPCMDHVHDFATGTPKER